MTPDAMKAYVQRHFQEFVNAKNVDIANETLADDFLDHDGLGGRPIDRDGDRAMMRAMHATDPASGKKIQFKGIVIWRLANGKLVERWASVDPPR
jgi:hypothetical protein